MENYNEILAKNILFFRKKHNMTQEELACICNISFQAISKWENNLTSPDISLLPIIAKTFRIRIDDLFNPIIEKEDDNVDEEDIRVVVYQGDKQILSKNPLFEKVNIELKGEIKNLYAIGDLNFLGTVNLKGSLEVSGNLKINTASTGSIRVGNDFVANTLSTGSVSCNDIKADALSSGSIKANNIEATKLSSGSIKCDNNVTAQKIECNGDLICNGTISIGEEVKTKKIRGKIVRNNQSINKQETDLKPDVDFKVQKDQLSELKIVINTAIKELSDISNKIKDKIIKETDDEKLDLLEDLQDDIEDLNDDLDDLLDDINDVEDDINDDEDEAVIEDGINDIRNEFKEITKKHAGLKSKTNSL